MSPSAIDHITNPSEPLLASSCEVLRSWTPTIVDYHGQGTMVGIAPDMPFEEAGYSPGSTIVVLGENRMNATFEPQPVPLGLPGVAPGMNLESGLILQEGSREFPVAGTGLVVTFELRQTGKRRTSFASVGQGRSRDGQ